MKLNYGSKIIVTILSITLMFYSMYQVAFVATYGNTANSGQTFISQVVSNVLPVGDTSGNSNVIPKTNTQQSGTTFTLDQLAKYNGQNGNPAYIAMDGVVYDVSMLGTWRNGMHHGVAAGTDLTGIFDQSPHVKTILQLGKKVGTLVSASAVNQVLPSQTATALVQADGVTSATTQGATTNVQNLVASNTNQIQATWTSQALMQYNGMNGNPAYIAVNGTIYDVTNFGSWQSGSHHGIKAGQDVTAAFGNSPHAASLLSQLPVVGQMGKPMQSNGGTAIASAKGLNGQMTNLGGDGDGDNESDD